MMHRRVFKQMRACFQRLFGKATHIGQRLNGPRPRIKKRAFEPVRAKAMTGGIGVQQLDRSTTRAQLFRAQFQIRQPRVRMGAMQGAIAAGITFDIQPVDQGKHMIWCRTEALVKMRALAFANCGLRCGKASYLPARRRW